MKKNAIVGICLFLFSVFSSAENPILKGFADPHTKVWNGKMYMAVGKDKDSTIKKFSMPYWNIYSSTDLRNWKLENKIDPKDNFMGKGNLNCWATDITTRNGKCYFYFSNGGNEIGVLVADKPEGTYIDILKKPMIPENFSVNHEYDPTIFKDDDGQYYIIFGRNGFDGKNLIHYQMAKLSNDMLSLAETPHDLMTDNLYGFGGPSRARDHQYFHKYKDTYYLSCGGDYRTSQNIYGPYTNPRKIAQIDGHSSFCEYNGQWYHIYEYTCEPYGIRQFRQISMTYLHYKDNGDMVDDENFIQGFVGSEPGGFLASTKHIPKGIYYATGVANYDSQWKKIEAEWFFKRVGSLEKKECPSGGFEIQNIQNNDYLNFPEISNLAPKSTIHFQISSANPKGGIIEIHQGSPKGRLLGKCNIKSTDNWSTYQTFSSKLINNTTFANLYFVFRGGNGELMRLDWFNFSK